MADIVLINPRFKTSYWAFNHAMPIFGVSAAMPVAGLPLLAALTPGKHTVTIIDEEVEEIDYERCRRADIVGVTGMSVQRRHMREVLTELKRRHIFTVVGGAWVSVKEDYFNGLADAIFVGEAEETWPQFLEDWEKGRHKPRYEQGEKTDMSRVPVPRFDLLKMDRYAWGTVQISRGCPFTCEFCDIIVTFGRRPRLKTSNQVIAELENLLTLGKREVFIVDDNFIGNRKGIIPILKDIIEWQHRHGFPFNFFTEATIDLADEPELLGLMTEASITGLFVGVETPDEAALREMKKYQNLPDSGGTMLEKIHRIQDSGIEIYSGMIVGFDNDDTGVFSRQLEFIRNARIVNAMFGMLTAIPKTPLHSRLEQAGRLDPEDEPVYATNIIPMNMSRDELRDGYLRVLTELYEPDAYFNRLDLLYLHGRLTYKGSANYFDRHLLKQMKRKFRFLIEAAVVFIRVFRVSEPKLRRVYARRMWRAMKQRLDSQLWLIYASRCAMHYHFYRMTEELRQSQSSIFNTY
jgi:radical SAM superfamily enzyme YgiQ (UPF0313 family)